MCMTGSDDWWDWYDEKSPVARKPQTCLECKRTIAKGETYHLQGGIHEGSFMWNKTCAHCNAASVWLVVVCDGWVFGLREKDLLSHVTGDEKELRSRPLVRLVRWMRADWRNQAGELRSVDEVRSLANEAVDAYYDKFHRQVAS